MTPQRLAQIRARRERLVAKAAVEREAMGMTLAPLSGPLAVADRGVSAVTYLRDHPAIVFVASAAFVVLSPRRAFRWARRAYALWRGYRLVAAAIDKRIPKG